MELLTSRVHEEEEEEGLAPRDDGELPNAFGDDDLQPYEEADAWEQDGAGGATPRPSSAAVGWRVL